MQIRSESAAVPTARLLTRLLEEVWFFCAPLPHLLASLFTSLFAGDREVTHTAGGEGESRPNGKRRSAVGPWSPCPPQQYYRPKRDLTLVLALGAQGHGLRARPSSGGQETCAQRPWREVGSLSGQTAWELIKMLPTIVSKTPGRVLASSSRPWGSPLGSYGSACSIFSTRRGVQAARRAFFANHQVCRTRSGHRPCQILLARLYSNCTAGSCAPSRPGVITAPEGARAQSAPPCRMPG